MLIVSLRRIIDMKIKRLLATAALSTVVMIASAFSVMAAGTEEFIVSVEADTLKLYKDAEFKEVLASAKKDEIYTMIEDLDNNVIKVSANGTEAYVNLDEGASLSPKSSEAEIKAESSTGKREALVNYALGFIGHRYVYGGTTPAGFDCSGFVQYVLRNSAGVSMPRTSASQSGVGTAIDASQMQPGDLIFYARGRVDHVGIYIGNGRIVHAANATYGVTTAPWNYRAPARIMRVF